MVIVDVIYPSFCVHCKTRGPSLCKACSATFISLDPAEPLPCFSIDSPFQAIAATFAYEGAAKSLVVKLKYSSHFFLAKAIASFMAIQFLELGWPLPDFIVPVPMSWIRKFERGYNHSLLIANELGLLLNVPVQDILKKKHHLPQAALSLNERKNPQSMRLKRRCIDISDKTILLVDDVLTTGSTLHTAANALFEECPAQIYALTFCYTA